MSSTRCRFPPRSRAAPGRPGAAHRCRRARLRRRGAQQPLGRIRGAATMPATASRSLDDLHAVIAFFEERRGRLHGFRWRDHADCKSCAPDATPAALDQPLGTGDGVTPTFPARSRPMARGFAPWTRAIAKPVAGTVAVAVDGDRSTSASTSPSTPTTGIVTFARPHPAGGCGGHRRLRVRRAGPLRHRQARDQPRRASAPAPFPQSRSSRSAPMKNAFRPSLAGASRQRRDDARAGAGA